MSEQSEQQREQQEVRVRRAPKYGAFMAVGAATGILVTLILTSLFPIDPLIGFGATFGYFAVFGIPIGIALGALIALGLDRLSRSRTRSVVAERDPVS